MGKRIRRRGGSECGGLCIGIDPGSQNEDNFLSTRSLAKILEGTPNIRMLMYLTPCYSGNWVVTPQLKRVKFTAMAAAQAHEESYAREASASITYLGGVSTSAFLKELQKQPVGSGLDYHCVNRLS